MKSAKHIVFLFVSTFLFLGIFRSSAQDNDGNLGALITDRPDVTESPTTVPKGYLQIETGSFFEAFEENNIEVERTVFNTTLLRYGIFENLELRVGWNIERITTRNLGVAIAPSLNGFSPLALGFKVAITDEKGVLPEIGLLGSAALPFLASTDFKPETTGIDLVFAFGHTLSDTSSLSYNLGASIGDGIPEISYVYSIAYGLSFTDYLGIYAELYGDFPENSRANHFWDAGITLLVFDNLQLDATVGTSITGGQDILVSAGASFRLPN